MSACFLFSLIKNKSFIIIIIRQHTCSFRYPFMFLLALSTQTDITTFIIIVTYFTFCGCCAVIVIAKLLYVFFPIPNPSFKYKLQFAVILTSHLSRLAYNPFSSQTWYFYTIFHKRVFVKTWTVFLLTSPWNIGMNGGHKLKLTNGNINGILWPFCKMYLLKIRFHFETEWERWWLAVVEGCDREKTNNGYEGITRGETDTDSTQLNSVQHKV